MVEKKKCNMCGKTSEVIPSNNVLVQGSCWVCVARQLDYNSIEDADLFCRTYNYPFDPDLWIKMAKEYQNRIFLEYPLFIIDNMDEYKTDTEDLWKALNEEWKLTRTHEELIAKLKPIKDGYVLRNKIKWGTNYSFEQLISLENLFVNTLKANNVSNPMQKDAIKKACKMSIALDNAIMAGDSKEINDLSKAYQNFVKTAKIDDLITASSQDVISNVAQLVQYIEDNDFQFQFYDNVDRDIVDKSLKDIQQTIRRLVLDATGTELRTILDTITASQKVEEAISKDNESYEKVSLEDLYENHLKKENDEFDKELEQEMDLELEDDDDDEYF